MQAPQGTEGSSRPPSPTSEKLAAVARDIGKVEADMEDVKQQIRSSDQQIVKVQQDKDEGWQEELAYLRRKEEQLRAYLVQEQQRLQRLQDKELLLLKREGQE